VKSVSTYGIEFVLLYGSRLCGATLHDHAGEVRNSILSIYYHTLPHLLCINLC